MAEVVGELPGLEIGDRIQVGMGIYRFDRIININTEPKLVFVLHELVKKTDE